MATRYWTPSEPLVAQVTTVTITLQDATTTYSITCGANTVSVTGLSTVNTIAAALQAAAASTTALEFGDMTWSVVGAVITATSNTSGYPFTITSAVSGGSGTLSQATTVANSGPNDFALAGNWGGTLPTGGDTMVFENGSVSALYNLNHFSGTSIANCTIRGSYTGVIALPTINAAGYPEYRPQFLQFGTCTVLYQGDPPQPTPGFRKFNVGSNACTATLIGNGNGQLGQETTWFVGTNASNVINATGASVAIAPLAAQTADVATINAIQGSVIRGGPGVATVTTVNLNSSLANFQSNVTTITMQSGSQLMTLQAMTVGTLNIWGGTVVYNSTGTITTLTVGSQDFQGSIDFSQANGSTTVTNQVTIYRGSTLNDPNKRLGSWSCTVPLGQPSDANITPGIGRVVSFS